MWHLFRAKGLASAKLTAPRSPIYRLTGYSNCSSKTQEIQAGHEQNITKLYKETETLKTQKKSGGKLNAIDLPFSDSWFLLDPMHGFYRGMALEV